MRSFVYIECRFLRESLEAYVTLVGPLAGVRAVVDLQVLLAGEGGRALQTLEGPPLHCGRATGLATAAAARLPARDIVAHIQHSLARRGRWAGRPRT